VYVDLKLEIFEDSDQQVITSKRQIVPLVTFFDLIILNFMFSPCLHY
jgi:hypothetical protein